MAMECISSDKLKERVLHGGEFIAIFSTKWCGFCRALIRELERSRVDFDMVEVDISSNDDTAWDEYGIEMVPTAVLFSSGREVARRCPTYDGLSVNDVRSLHEMRRV